MKISKKRKTSELFPLLPMRDIVVFPKLLIPLVVGRKKSINAVEYATSEDRLIFVSAQKNFQEETPTIDNIYQTGVIAEILQVLKLPDGTLKILIEGIKRVRVLKFYDEPLTSFIEVKIENIPNVIRKNFALEAEMRNIISLFNIYFKCF